MHLSRPHWRAPNRAPGAALEPTRRPRSHAQRRRGQSLAEFAITLPIILFLLLISLDFGRVYLGWINLQSMARIAANFAANNPMTAAEWANPADTQVVAYQNLIRADALATNCHLPLVAGIETAPTPTFTDVNGDGMRGIGDTAEVALTCQFGVITPGISRVLGSSVAVSASSVFPVKAGMTATGGGGGGGGSAPSAAFTGNGTVTPNSLTGIKPFNVVFRDTSGGGPTSWAWDFDGDGTIDSTLQDPLDHPYTTTGTFIVRMTATNAKGSSTASMGVTVVDSGTVDFTADQTSGNAPLAVQFTSTSAAGGTAYAWTFGAGEGSGTGATASHTYSIAGTYSVSLTVTYANGNLTQTKTNYITVNPKLCTVPSFNGVKRNAASAKWTGAGFTAANLSSGAGAPGGNGWTITTQTITANSIVACNATIQVNDH